MLNKSLTQRVLMSSYPLRWDVKYKRDYPLPNIQETLACHSAALPREYGPNHVQFYLITEKKEVISYRIKKKKNNEQTKI